MIAGGVCAGRQTWRADGMGSAAGPVLTVMQVLDHGAVRVDRVERGSGRSGTMIRAPAATSHAWYGRTSSTSRVPAVGRNGAALAMSLPTSGQGTRRRQVQAGVGERNPVIGRHALPLFGDAHYLLQPTGRHEHAGQHPQRALGRGVAAVAPQRVETAGRPAHRGTGSVLVRTAAALQAVQQDAARRWCRPVGGSDAIVGTGRLQRGEFVCRQRQRRGAEQFA
ncbi:hypothetical protein [Xanthomonas sp. XNM01]|uniref:hypothetical protein n=1 Tax=Xanthomonas sp. XNM01 TaxID=2769289 RepID=UPI00177EF173|nr:hypothetical protein [Xanthomonas sp. XNM01]MBD9370351.1 hypothetical protein [Xanthomonas sp. XNM01]